MPPDPKAEYLRRLEEARARAALLDRRHIALGNAKLAIIVITALLAWFGAFRGAFSPWWLLAPAAVFVALMMVHERVVRARQLAARAIGFYERGLDRLAGQWTGKGEPGERFREPAHPYCEDLDLFGPGSLYELLCTVRTRTGEETLARWLLHPAAPELVRARQQAVEELRPNLGLREDLALLGEEVRSGINPKALAAWCEQPVVFDSVALRAVAAVLGLIGLAMLPFLLLLTSFGGTPMAPVVAAVVLINIGFIAWFRKRTNRVFEGIEKTEHGIELLSLVMLRFERDQFASPLLADLRAALDAEGQPPSKQMARLHRLLELTASRDHVFVRAFGWLVLYDPQLAFAIEAWRKRSGPAVRRWLEVVGEIEALVALSGYAYEHPADPFPELAEESPCYEGEALGHPLVPEARMVRNDVRLGGDLRVLVVSGSNMSGKSTLLRTVGVNAVLALAGAPVRARRLRLSPLNVGASIRVTDSLQGGASRFYAQIVRLRSLVDLTKDRTPLLFLLDELLHGTNSHDRRIGAEGVVRGLVERGAVGLLTTHDLALSHIADVLAPRGRNVHFEDQLENGRMTFDYTLRPGIVQKSNALELMRSVGLDV